MVYVLFAVGVVLLVVGAEALVRGASRLAAAVGVTPLVVGLTIVAFGTSSPELTVSVTASMSGDAGGDVAVGNVIGSNILSVLLILGASAVITPLAVAQKLVRVDVPIMIGLSVVLLVLALDGRITRLEGALLFAGILAYMLLVALHGRRESREVEREYEVGLPDAAPPDPRRPHPLWQQILLIVGGLALLVVGSRWIVNGAVAIATEFGVSQLVIGLTIVAIGTSLPEVATSIMASIRGERDIAVGNVIGSNIFNILAVLGLSALVGQNGLGVSQAALTFDIPVMIATSIVCLPIFMTGHRIGRLEGSLFLTYYLAYVGYLIAAATQHDALDVFSTTMLLIVGPATLVVLLLPKWRSARGL